MSLEVIRDTLKYLPAKIVPAIVGLLSIPVLTRFLSPDEYGQYLIVMTSLILLSSFCISWLVSVTIRFHVLSGVLPLLNICRPFLVLSLFIGTLLWILLSYLKGYWQDNVLYVWAGIFWMILYGVYEYFIGWMRARNFATAYSVALSWRSIAGLGFAILMLWYGFEGGEFVIIGTIISMIFVLSIIPKYALKSVDIKIVDEKKPVNISDILKYGIPVAFSNFVITGLSLADRYFIDSYMGVQAVAVYGANYDLAEKTVFFGNSMLLLSSSVIGYRIFEREGEKNAAIFLSQLMRIYLIIAPPVVVLLALLSMDIIYLILPTKYFDGHIVFPIVGLSGLLVGVMHRYSLLLSFYKRTDIILACSVGALIANLLSCFILIPLYGLVGAAISTTIAYFLWLFFIRFAANKFAAPTFPWKTLLRVSLALAVTIPPTYLMLQKLPSPVNYLNLLFLFLFGLFFYFLLLVFFNEISKTEVKKIIFLHKSGNG